jgi:hypothetical protein
MINMKVSGLGYWVAEKYRRVNFHRLLVLQNSKYVFPRPLEVEVGYLLSLPAGFA